MELKNIVDSITLSTISTDDVPHLSQTQGFAFQDIDGAVAMA
jgi:hypothetical protein